MENVRPWHVGILFDKGVSLAEATMAGLRAADPTLNVGANVPYAVSVEEDYGLLVHSDHAGNPAILIEIRQDLIAIPATAEDWARRLAPMFAAACVSSIDASM